MRQFFPFTLLLVLAAGLLSCSESKYTPYIPPQTSGFEDLKEKDDVLFNLGETYKQRDIFQYDRLLDEHFVFHFAEADWNANPPRTPVAWTRMEEVGATTNMFNPNFSKPGQDPISSIDLSLLYAPGNWTAVASGDQVHYPGETWYQKSLKYTLTITAGDDTYFTNGEIAALFKIRFAELEGDSIWRIVLWHDGTSSASAQASRNEDGFVDTSRHSASEGVESTTWGGVKALYGGGG